MQDKGKNIREDIGTKGETLISAEKVVCVSFSFGRRVLDQISSEGKVHVAEKRVLPRIEGRGWCSEKVKKDVEKKERGGS